MTFSYPADLPQHITQALGTLTLDLQSQGGEDFVGLALYGGVARGRYRPGRSDVNVVVLIKSAEARVLENIAPALRDARRAAAVDAMLLTSAELPLAARDFPSKYLDIQRHHVMLFGPDLFASLDIPIEAVRQRVAQTLRNQLIRLRHRFVAQCDEPPGLQLALLNAARPLAVDLISLLICEGHPVPEEDRTAAIFQAASTAFGLDANTLSELSALREGGPPADVADLFARVLALLSKLADHVDALAGHLS